jgi:hypothetical protein
MIQETYEVKCPSGLSGIMRPLTVGDISAASAMSGKRNIDPLGKILRGVWTETKDAGPYAGSGFVVEGEKIDQWEKILVGDRNFLVYEARRITYGEDFYFTVPCHSCRKKIDWKISLTDLETRGMSEEFQKAVATSGIVDAVVYMKLPLRETKVGIRLFTGNDQRNVESVANKGEGAMGEAAILSRLAYIEGAVSPGDRRSFVQNMHLADVEWLREQWEKMDVYTQEIIEIECPHCFSEHTIRIPVDDRFFSRKSAG